MNHDVLNIEATWIRLNKSNINICSFYRSHNYCSVENFIEYMHICMKKFNGKKVVWIGDVNIDQNNINSSQYKKLDMPTSRKFEISSETLFFVFCGPLASLANFTHLHLEYSE